MSLDVRAIQNKKRNYDEMKIHTPENKAKAKRNEDSGICQGVINSKKREQHDKRESFTSKRLKHDDLPQPHLNRHTSQIMNLHNKKILDDELHQEEEEDFKIPFTDKQMEAIE